jgi:HTH-like domain
LPDEELVAQIKAVIAELPTYGYRRVHAILKRQALAAGLKPANHKRVYWVMKVRGLLLDRHAGDDRMLVLSVNSQTRAKKAETLFCNALGSLTGSPLMEMRTLDVAENSSRSSTLEPFYSRACMDISISALAAFQGEQTSKSVV